MGNILLMISISMKIDHEFIIFVWCLLTKTTSIWGVENLGNIYAKIFRNI